MKRAPSVERGFRTRVSAPQVRDDETNVRNFRAGDPCVWARRDLQGESAPLSFFPIILISSPQVLSEGGKRRKFPKMQVIIGKFCPSAFWPFLKDSVREICAKRLGFICLMITSPLGCLGNRPRDTGEQTGCLPGRVVGVNSRGQEEKLGCDAASGEAACYPSGSSEAEVTLQDCYDLEREDQTSVAPRSVPHWMWAS